MDWIVIASMVVAGWAVLSVLSGERMNRAQQIAMALAKLAADQAKERESQIPIAMSSDAVLKGKR